MSEFVLIQTILTAILGVMWASWSFRDVAIKVSLYGLTVWGLYLLFGPADLIHKFYV